MPPTRPANTIRSSASPLTDPRLTTPFATVAATSTERKAPTRFRVAESATATFGRSAPVAMEVAIAFPVSWKPFVKSKARAVTTTTKRTTSSAVTTELCVSKAQKYSEQPANRRCASPHSAITSHDGPGTVATLTSICRCVGPHSSVSLTGTGSRAGVDARYGPRHRELIVPVTEVRGGRWWDDGGGRGAPCPPSLPKQSICLT